MTLCLFQETTKGVRFFVRLTPKAAHNRIDGIGQDAAGRAVVKARVTAIPEKGKANQALIKLLATSIGLPKSTIHLMSGDTDRNKTLLISGEPQSLMATLKTWQASLE